MCILKIAIMQYTYHTLINGTTRNSPPKASETLLCWLGQSVNEGLYFLSYREALVRPDPCLISTGMSSHIVPKGSQDASVSSRPNQLICAFHFLVD